MSDGFGEVLGTKTNEIDTRSGNAERGEREIGTTTKHGKELIGRGHPIDSGISNQNDPNGIPSGVNVREWRNILERGRLDTNLTG